MMDFNWKWDIESIDKDLDQLILDENVSISEKTSSNEDHGDFFLIFNASKIKKCIFSSTQRIETLQNLAYVTQLHLEQFQKNFRPGSPLKVSPIAIGVVAPALDELDTTAPTPQSILDILHKRAGEWSEEKYLDHDGNEERTQKVDDISQELYKSFEMSNPLEGFATILKQIFADHEKNQLEIPVQWIRPLSSSTTNLKCGPNPQADLIADELVSVFDGGDLTSIKYAEQLAHTNRHRIQKLTEAEAFQDAKDIKRDELVINDEAFTGVLGYDAIVDILVDRIQKLLNELLECNTNERENQPSKTRLIDVAKQILHATNRTESGGCSYEILSKLISNHSQDHVLLRPDSSKAKPLTLHMDIGPFRTTNSSSLHRDTASVWHFGLRVHLQALTKYLICDAQDPTTELFVVDATYHNRLAFSLDLTPFVSSQHVRQDAGHVIFTLESLIVNKEYEKVEKSK